MVGVIGGWGSTIDLKKWYTIENSWSMSSAPWSFTLFTLNWSSPGNKPADEDTVWLPQASTCLSGSVYSLELFQKKKQEMFLVVLGLSFSTGESRCSESISVVRGLIVLINFAVEKMRKNDTIRRWQQGRIEITRTWDWMAMESIIFSSGSQYVGHSAFMKW